MANVNGFDGAAWSVDGARHEAELLRVLAYATGGGAEGVVTPGDCKVHQLAAGAGPQVVIDPGALQILNRHPNVVNQLYVANGRDESRLDVDPTTASSRSDAVIVRVEDPEYSAWTTPPIGDAPLFQYVKPVVIKGVSASANKFSDLGLNYAGYLLARIDLPSGTTNITDAMIKNKRQVALPRSLRKHIRVPLVAPHQMNVTAFTNFPAASAPFDVPTWATEMIIRVDLTSLEIVGNTLAGEFRAVYGPFGQPFTAGTVSTLFSEVPNTGRKDFVISDQIAVPVSARGTTRYVYTQALRYPMPQGGAGILEADEGSAVIYDIEFLETAV